MTLSSNTLFSLLACYTSYSTLEEIDITNVTTELSGVTIKASSNDSTAFPP